MAGLDSIAGAIADTQNQRAAEGRPYVSWHPAAMGEAAVDGDDGAARIGAKIGREEDHGRGDLVT